MVDVTKANPADLVNVQRYVNLVSDVLDASVKFRSGLEYHKTRMLADLLPDAASVKTGVSAPSDWCG